MLMRLSLVATVTLNHHEFNVPHKKPCEFGYTKTTEKKTTQSRDAAGASKTIAVKGKTVTKYLVTATEVLFSETTIYMLPLERRPVSCGD